MIPTIKKAYLAGFLDGDGSIYVRAKPSTDYRYGFQIAPYIVLFQSSKNLKQFEEVCALIPFGKMRQRKDGMLEYVINRLEDIEAFLSMMEPFSLMKKEQIKLMRMILECKREVKDKEDFAKLLQLIDTFRGLNYSTNRKERALTP